MYEAVGGLRRLLHGVTSAGVAAAHYADLEALQAEYQRESKALTTSLENAKQAEATKLTTWTQLRTERVDLLRTHDKQSFEVTALDVKIAAAEQAYTAASNHVVDRWTALNRNKEQLKRVQSHIDANRGASCL